MHAGDLKTGDRFAMRATGKRGVVEDIRQVVSGHDASGNPILVSAPRVMLVGNRGEGIVHRTLHPDVQVDLLY